MNSSDPSGMQSISARDKARRFLDCIRRGGPYFQKQVKRARDTATNTGCTIPQPELLTRCKGAGFKGITLIDMTSCRQWLRFCLDEIDLMNCEEVQQVYLHEMAQIANTCINCKKVPGNIASNCATPCDVCLCMEIQALTFSGGCEPNGQFNRRNIDVYINRYDRPKDCIAKTAARACSGTCGTNRNVETKAFQSIKKCRSLGFPQPPPKEPYREGGRTDD